MHGLGDNIHQRAVIKHLINNAGRMVWLETPWPSVYDDFSAGDLYLLKPNSSLRTQANNERREAARYCFSGPPPCETLRVHYPPHLVREQGSVLGAMLAATGSVSPLLADFRMPVPEAWKEAARTAIGANPGKPVLVYRPLVERKEWTGCKARNPDHEAYFELFEEIRRRFYVVSIADLMPGIEWIASRPIVADATFHCGELAFETLAGLVAISSMVYCSPGFLVPLAQAIGRPSICVFGGYESSRSFSAGSRWAPYLGIDTVSPCECFRHDHACEKRIDLDRAKQRMGRFVDAYASANICSVS